MFNGIRECDVFGFCELYAVLVAFADEPTNVISRMGGESFEEWFWRNKGFLRHPDWIEIRELARAYLLR